MNRPLTSILCLSLFLLLQTQIQGRPSSGHRTRAGAAPQVNALRSQVTPDASRAVARSDLQPQTQQLLQENSLGAHALADGGYRSYTKGVDNTEIQRDFSPSGNLRSVQMVNQDTGLMSNARQLPSGTWSLYAVAPSGYSMDGSMYKIGDNQYALVSNDGSVKDFTVEPDGSITVNSKGSSEWVGDEVSGLSGSLDRAGFAIIQGQSQEG